MTQLDIVRAALDGPPMVRLPADDASLGAMVCSAMAVGAKPEHYAALGRVVRAGVVALGAAALEQALRRGGRR